MAFASAQDAEEAWRFARQLLSLVRSLSGQRNRGPGRQNVAAVTRVEPDPRQDAQEIVQLALDEPELSPREKATSSRKIPSTACLRHII